MRCWSDAFVLPLGSVWELLGVCGHRSVCHSHMTRVSVASCAICCLSFSEALSDRFAIESDNKINVVLSPQQLVSCDTKDGNMGCGGGYPLKAWQYMMSSG